MLIGPRRGQLVFDGIRQPLESLGIVLAVLRHKRINGFEIRNHGRKRKRDRRRANDDFLQHLPILLFRRNAHRRLQQRVRIRDLTPVNAQV